MNGTQCDRHGGPWGGDETCERCTYEDGSPRPEPALTKRPAGRAHALIAEYDMVGAWWARLCEETEGAGDPVSVKDCEKYSGTLEQLAHQFAAFVRDVFGED